MCAIQKAEELSGFCAEYPRIDFFDLGEQLREVMRAVNWLAVADQEAFQYQLRKMLQQVKDRQNISLAVVVELRHFRIQKYLRRPAVRPGHVVPLVPIFDHPYWITIKFVNLVRHLSHLMLADEVRPRPNLTLH